MQAKIIAISQRYNQLYDSLISIIQTSEVRVLDLQQDDLFANNVNFFVKAYLTNICSYLEAFLQDLAFEYAKSINERIKLAKIPHNIVYWKTANEIKSNKLLFKNTEISVTRQDISDNLSANPYKTINTYRLLGINVESEQGFIDNKDLVNAVVTKRNNIIHHNDQAVDVSFSDLVLHIEVFKKYMAAISKALENTIAGNG